MADIASLVIKLTAKVAPAFHGAINQAKALLKGLQAKVSGAFGKVAGGSFIGSLLGTVGGGGISDVIGSITNLFSNAFTSLVKNIKEAQRELERIGDAAEGMGITSAALIGLEHAATLAGASASDMGIALSRLQRLIGDAASGSERARRSFSVLGLSARELADMPLDQAMEQVAQQIAQMPNAADRAAASYEIFGRQSARLAAMMREGAGAMRMARIEAQVFGATVTEEESQRIRQTQDMWQRAALAARGVNTQFSLLTADAQQLTAGFQISTAIAQNFFMRLGRFLHFLTNSLIMPPT